MRVQNFPVWMSVQLYAAIVVIGDGDQILIMKEFQSKGPLAENKRLVFQLGSVINQVTYRTFTVVQDQAHCLGSGLRLSY